MIMTSPTLAEALRLTRAGRLAEATALIKAGLSGIVSAGSDDGPGHMIDIAQARPLLANESHGRATVAEKSPAAIFLERQYTDGGKALPYRLYVPAHATAGMPLVVMLHGCTQSAEDFARGTGMNQLADELGFLVAYPSQSQAANAQKCWNWFKPADQRRDRGEPGMIAGLTRQVIADQQCDPRRVYIAGLSAGGAAAAIMSAAYPDLYAAVGIHSGLPCGAARDLSSALMAMQQGSRTASAPGPQTRFVPVITFHGDRDKTVNEINSRDIVSAASQAAGAITTRKEHGQAAGGRRYTREISENSQGDALIEQWTIHGGGHAWSGGSPAGSYTDGAGPDASREMLRFFLAHRL